MGIFASFELRAKANILAAHHHFRKPGLIGYKGRIQAHDPPLSAVLLDQLPEHNSRKPAMAVL
jgi:hypothetical protein